MKDIYEFLKELGIDLIWIAMGLFGGTLMISSTRRKLNLKQKFLMVLTGAVLANFATPLIIWFLGMPETVSGAVSFFVGLLGLEVVKKILITYIDKKIKTDDN
jgi:uncharacterized membrane protein